MLLSQYARHTHSRPHAKGRFPVERIFIATPTHICKRYCATEFVGSVLSHALDVYDCEFHIAGNSEASCEKFYSNPRVKYNDMDLPSTYFKHREAIHQRIVYTANFLRRAFLESDCKFYLSLEADVMLHAHDMQELVRNMVSLTDWDVLHTNCYANFNRSLVREPTNRITMGCTLVRRAVLEEVSFRYDSKVLAAHYDAFFCKDAIAENYRCVYEPSIKPDHRDQSNMRGWVEIPYSERG